MSRTSFGRPTALLLVIAVVVVACGGANSGSSADGSPGPSTQAASANPTAEPMASGDPAVRLCVAVDALDKGLAGLVAIELRLPNRVALEIELGKVQAAYSELRQAELGELDEQLEDPLKRLGYRLVELELAIEDFRTNSRPKRAVPHVEEDAGKLTSSVAAFTILARC